MPPTPHIPVWVTGHASSDLYDHSFSHFSSTSTSNSTLATASTSPPSTHSTRSTSFSKFSKIEFILTTLGLVIFIFITIHCCLRRRHPARPTIWLLHQITRFHIPRLTWIRRQFTTDGIAARTVREYRRNSRRRHQRRCQKCRRSVPSSRAFFPPPYTWPRGPLPLQAPSPDYYPSTYPYPSQVPGSSIARPAEAHVAVAEDEDEIPNGAAMVREDWEPRRGREGAGGTASLESGNGVGEGSRSPTTPSSADDYLMLASPVTTYLIPYYRLDASRYRNEGQGNGGEVGAMQMEMQRRLGRQVERVWRDARRGAGSELLEGQEVGRRISLPAPAYGEIWRDERVQEVRRS